MKCLEVNDRLTKMLNDVDTAEWIGEDSGAPAADAAAAAASPTSNNIPPVAPMSDSMLSQDYSTSVPPASATSLAASASTADSASPAPTGSTSNIIQPTKSEDEFDDFFNERIDNK